MRIATEFFSVYYFVITCAVGTVLQGAFYGMAFGWLSVAIAFVFVDSQLRSLRSYLDELSGLFGRKYMNYCLERIHATQEKITRIDTAHHAQYLTGDMYLKGLGGEIDYERL